MFKLSYLKKYKIIVQSVKSKLHCTVLNTFKTIYMKLVNIYKHKV